MMETGMDLCPKRGLQTAACLAIIFAVFAPAGCTPKGAQQKRAEYLIMNPDIPKPIRNAIKNKQIIAGMTMADTEVSWGKPRNIEASKSGQDEAWTYRRKVYGAGWHAQKRTYRVVFIQGRVVTWQEIERTR